MTSDIPAAQGGNRPTHGTTLAVVQVKGGSRSVGTADRLRILGRGMRLLTIPNQPSVPTARRAFGPDGRIVGAMEERRRIGLLARDRRPNPTDRDSERWPRRDAPALPDPPFPIPCACAPAGSARGEARRRRAPTTEESRP